MIQRLRSILFVSILALSVGTPRSAHAEPMRDFILSCSYGVLAGTLVGAATLAFSDKPGDNLNKVARGASIGLYAGILLGLYVVYGGGSDAEDEAAAAGIVRYKFREPPRLLVAPIVSERGFEGGAANYTLVRF